MDAGSEIFQKVKPQCVTLVQFAFESDNTTKSIEQYNALKELDKTLHESVNDTIAKFGDDFLIPISLADYIMVPISKILQSDTVSDTALEHILSIIHVLLKYSWCKPGALSKEVLTQYITLITYLIGGKPGQFKFTQNCDEKYFNGVLCLKELLVGCMYQDSQFFGHIIQNSSIIPTLGFMVSILLGIATESKISSIKVTSLEALNLLFHLLNDGEILSMFFPGTVSTIAKIIKTKPHSDVVVIAFTTLTSITNLIFSDFDLDIEMEDRIDSLDALKSNIKESFNEEDMHVELEIEHSDIIKMSENHDPQNKRRTISWLSNTIPQFQKALNIILNIDLTKYDRNPVKDAIFQFDVKLVRNCFVSCNPLMSIVLKSLSSVCYADTTYTEQAVESLCYTVNFDALKKIISRLIDNELLYMQHTLMSPDSNKIKRMLQIIIFSLNILNGFDDMEYSIIDNLLTKLQESLSLIIKMRNSEVKDKKLSVDHSLQSNAIQNQIMMVTSHYKINSFEEVQNEFMFSGLFSKETEKFFYSLFQSMANNYKIFKDYDEIILSLDFESNSNTVIETAVRSWMISTIMKYSGTQKDDSFDSFIQFEEHDVNDDNDLSSSDYSTSLALQNSSYASLESSVNILKQCSSMPAHQYSITISTIMALRTVNNAMDVLKEEFENELIDVLYPVIECLASENEMIRFEAQKVSLEIANLLYDGSIQKMISENSDYLVDSLSSKLVAEELTPKVPIILSVIVKLGSMDIVSELDDIIKTIFTLLDIYYGYNSLVEGFFLVFDEVISKVYEDLKDFDFDQYSVDIMNENVQYFGMWGLKSDDDVDEFINKKAVVMDDLLDDSDDEDDDLNEPIKKDKLLEIDSDDSDNESETKSIPSVKENGDVEEDDDSKWTSPVDYKLYTTISNILSYAERLMQSNSIQLTIILLRIMNRIIPILATQHSKFLPIAAQMWELISHTIENIDDLRVTSLCIEIFHSLLKYGNTFFTARFIEIYRKLTKNKRLRPIIRNQINKIIASETNGEMKTMKINRTSTSTNWEYEIFKKICELLVFTLQKLGRFIANDIAISVISLTIWYNPNVDDYEYFDELAIFLSSYKIEHDITSRIELD